MHGERGRRNGGGIGRGAESGSVLAEHPQKWLGRALPRVCLHVVCASAPSRLAASEVLGGRVSRQPEGQGSASLPAAVLQAASTNTNPATEGSSGRRSSRPPRRSRAGGPGPRRLVAAGLRGLSRGVESRGGSFLGGRWRGWGGKEKGKSTAPPRLSPLCACLCSPSTSAGRPCSPGGGGGDGQAEEARGGFSSDHFSPSRTWKGRFPKV